MVGDRLTGQNESGTRGGTELISKCAFGSGLKDECMG